MQYSGCFESTNFASSISTPYLPIGHCNVSIFVLNNVLDQGRDHKSRPNEEHFELFGLHKQRLILEFNKTIQLMYIVN